MGIPLLERFLSRIRLTGFPGALSVFWKWKSKIADGHVAVGFCADKVMVIWLDCAGTGSNQIKLKKYFSLPNSAPHAQQALDDCGFPTRAIGCLSHDGYKLDIIQKPNVKEDEVIEASAWAVAEMLEQDAQNLVVDVFHHPGGDESQVYAVAATVDAVGGLCDKLYEYGFDVTNITIPDIAQRNVAALYCTGKEDVVMFVSVANSHILMTISSRESLYFSRQISSVGNDNLSRLEGISEEIVRTISAYDRQYAWLPIAKIVITIGNAGFVTDLSILTGIRCMTFMVSDVLVLEGEVDGDLGTAEAVYLLGSALDLCPSLREERA